MNYKLVFSTVLKVVKLESALMLLPLLTSLIFKESCFYDFLITMAVSFTLAHVIEKFIKPTSKYFYSKDGFITVALTWIIVSLIGAVPFVISGEIPSFIDAFFEMVSGFTTTGATILSDVENISKGLLMWRSFSHFIGGMGVLVFIMAITSKTTDRPIHILRAEMPGPMVSKLVPKSKDTAKILYLMYIVLTAVLVVMLLFGKMPLYDSLVHAFGTAGTGGFGIKNSSIGGYNDYIQWVIAIFMLLYGVNFNLYYFLIIKRTFSVLKSSELRTYIIIIATAVIAIFINIYPLYQNVYETIKISFFQVSSIITTTGYGTVDINSWPALSKTILLSLMFIGGCSGSTAGGIKISRFLLAFKKIKAELKKLLHPNTVSVIKLEGEKVDDDVISGLSAYFTLYFISFIALTLIVATNGLPFETTFSAVCSCFNNIGPIFGEGVQNFSCFNGFSKIILSITMLLGRLEIYPLLLAFIPSTWAKSKI
ncbi:MAG: TrkH family potassium uptake protein [Clostridiales bacterium]|nr:TrkH family potassium uptake protein [Clostridiales bacterium]